LEGQTKLLGGKIFVFIICLKQFFMRTTKFGGAQKNWGEIAPEYSPVAAGLLSLRLAQVDAVLLLLHSEIKGKKITS